MAKYKTTIEQILNLKAQGKTNQAISKILHLGITRQGIDYLIKKNRNKPELKELYKKMDETMDFLKGRQNK